MITSKKNHFPTVFITPEAKQRLDLYLQCASGEISGLGSVQKMGDDFLITQVYLFEQKCSASGTELDSESVASFLLEAVRAGLDTSVLKLWWHSHVNMSCFWSGDDDDTAKRLAMGGWFISVVGVKSGDYLCRLDMYDPVRITLDGVDFRVCLSINPALRKEVEMEVKQKVKPIIIPRGKKVSKNYPTYGYGSYYNWVDQTQLEED